jgi:hypothetical protein
VQKIGGSILQQEVLCAVERLGMSQLKSLEIFAMQDYGLLYIIKAVI